MATISVFCRAVVALARQLQEALHVQNGDCMGICHSCCLFQPLCRSELDLPALGLGPLPATARLSSNLYSLPVAASSKSVHVLHALTEATACLFPWLSGSWTLFQQVMHFVQ